VLADFLQMNPDRAPGGMQRVEGFVQRFPNDGEGVTERTVVFVGYDDRALHVAFLCFDREPNRIGAHMVGRDLLPNDEDSIAVHLDTFRDLKHGYGFQVNPLGVQTDGTYTEGSGWDLSWDTVWSSEARLTPRGFVVLVGIPFRSLRFPASDVQEWGIFFYRAIARKNEQVYWPANSTRKAARFPQAAVATGLERVSPGRNLQAIPYAATRSFRAIDAGAAGGAAFASDGFDPSAGIDAKAVIRDSLVLDATVNPDFSQVESDQPQITVNRPFEVFFPEKRPFFLENAAAFNTPIPLLFTRRIADPRMGGRASGRLGSYSVGAMVVDDRAPLARGAGAAALFGVARVIRDIGRESYIGAFASTRRAGADTNTVTALDSRMKIGSNWAATAQSAVSRSNGPYASGTGSATVASLAGSGRQFNYDLTLNDRSPAFQARSGFVPRVDLRSIDQSYSYRVRRGNTALQAWGPDLVVNRTWSHDGRPLDWSVTPRLGFQWPRVTTLTVYYTAGRQRLRPAEVAGLTEAVDVPADRAGMDFSTAAFRRIVGSMSWFRGHAANLTPVPGALPQRGAVADANLTVSLRVTRALTVDGSYLNDRLQIAGSPRPAYSNNIVRLRAGDQFSRALALRAIVQYSSLSVDPSATVLQRTRGLNYDVLLTYLVSPGTAFYVGGNYDLANLDRRLIGTPYGLLRSDALINDGWQMFAKMSYLFRR
jgi:uncharacterized protein DUF5916